MQLPWSNWKLIVFVTSTTGDGDPPDNAASLYKKLKKNECNPDYLAHISYALLGLGDSNYTTFGGFPQLLDKQLQKLGAKRIYNFKLADDAVGLEIVVDPWIESLWKALILQEPCTLSSSLAELDINDPKPLKTDTNIAEPIAKQSDDNSSELKKPIQAVDPEANLKVEPPAKNIGSLTLSCEPLSKLNLKIPILSKPYLEMEFQTLGTDVQVSVHC